MIRENQWLMRRRGSLGLALALLLWGTLALPAMAAGNSYKLKVDGLACPFCSYGIEKQLRTVPGVAKVRVLVKSGQVIVTMKDGRKLSRAAASGAVTRAGFTLAGFRN